MRTFLVFLLAAALENAASFNLVRHRAFQMESLLAKKDKKASTYKPTAGCQLFIIQS